MIHAAFLFKSFINTTGHNKIAAGMMMSLNQSDVPLAPSSVFSTLKKENQQAKTKPVIK